jgi:hypothetical protein
MAQDGGSMTYLFYGSTWLRMVVLGPIYSTDLLYMAQDGSSMTYLFYGSTWLRIVVL